MVEFMMKEMRYGYCQCGCGNKTLISTYTRNKDGRKKGKPIRFIKGHGQRNKWLNNNGEKKCTKCNNWLSLNNFRLRKDNNSTYTSHCKDCCSKCAKPYYKKNKKKIDIINKKWRKENPEKVAEGIKRWKKENPEKVRMTWEKYQKENREKCRIAWKKSAKKNRSKSRERERVYCKDGRYRLDKNISRSIRSALGKNKNGYKWEVLVGYTLDKLVNHIEKQFQPGMAWKNYGEWHLDHEIPKSKFNYTKPGHRDFKRCWALKNLRPMWAQDNLSKGAKLDKPFQPSLPI